MNEQKTQQPVVGEERPFADRVTEMSRQELQRRVLTQRDYIARYQRCIDGLGLSGPDGHRLPGDITAAVREMWLAEGAAGDSAKAPIADGTAFDSTALLGVALRAPKNHLLKCWPAFYADVVGGRKPFECRKADRDFRVGDTLVLEEWNPETHAYTGSVHRAEVTYLMRGPAFGVAAGWVVLGLATPNS